MFHFSYCSGAAGLTSVQPEKLPVRLEQERASGLINMFLLRRFRTYPRTMRRASVGIKPGPKRIAKSTGKPDRRQRDNKEIPGNTRTLKPHKHKKGD